METEIKMTTVASSVFSYIIKNPDKSSEEIYGYFVKRLDKRADEITNRAVVASIGKAIEISVKNPKLSEKGLLKEFVEQIPVILKNINK